MSFYEEIAMSHKIDESILPTTQRIKIDLNKKSLPKQKTIQNFNIDGQGFRKTRNETPPKQE